MEMTCFVPSATLKMKSVRAACYTAPDGPAKQTALKHYQVAETAHLAGHEADCNSALDAATRALAP